MGGPCGRARRGWETVAAAEEERFSRRKDGKAPIPVSIWEMPEQSAARCLRTVGVGPGDVGAVAYPYDPNLGPRPNGDLTAEGWEPFAPATPSKRLTLDRRRPGIDAARFRFVPHHVAHAASAYLASPAQHPVSEPRELSGLGFGYGPGLLDEVTAVKVIHLEPAPADA